MICFIARILLEEQRFLLGYETDRHRRGRRQKDEVVSPSNEPRDFSLSVQVLGVVVIETVRGYVEYLVFKYSQCEKKHQTC